MLAISEVTYIEKKDSNDERKALAVSYYWVIPRCAQLKGTLQVITVPLQRVRFENVKEILLANSLTISEVIMMRKGSA